MAECYGSWLCQQTEDEYNRRDRIQEACEKVESELETLLENNGFGDLYSALSGSITLENAITAEAKALNPELFH